MFREYDQDGRPDGYLIHRCVADAGVPLITDLQLARALIEALRRKDAQDLKILAWDDYLMGNQLLLNEMGPVWTEQQLN